MINIDSFVGKIKDLDELVDIQEEIQAHGPSVVFLAITYPTGNTGYFFGYADKDYYNTTSVGKDIYDRVVGALYSDTQPILDS